MTLTKNEIIERVEKSSIKFTRKQSAEIVETLLELIKNKVVIFSAIDNLVKGASGQAIQNMNQLYKYPEYLGLR